MAVSDLYPIFDGHNDTLLNLAVRERGGGRSFFERSETGHLDLPRARAGGYGGGFFAVFTPGDPADAPEANVRFSEKGFDVPLAPPIDPERARRLSMSLMALLFRLERESKGQMMVIRTAAELAVSLERGVLAAVLHLEGADAIDEDLDTLEVFFQAGLRSLGIVWSRPNAFGQGVPFGFPRTPDAGPGLTEAGKRLVRRCNQLGVMLDLSHLNERGFWDVAHVSEAPLVATHSNAYALCRSSRNLTDRQLDAIRDSDGMVGVCFDVSMLRVDGGIGTDTSLDTIVNHIDYLAERVGISRVGLGSDFDGTQVPDVLGNVAGLPNLVQALRVRGYDGESLRKVLFANWLRVLTATWGR